MFQYIDAEVKYAVKEYAATAVDIIARRLRLSFLNVQAAEESLPVIVQVSCDWCRAGHVTPSTSRSVDTDGVSVVTVFL